MNFDRKLTDWVWLDLDDTLWDFAANSHESLAELYNETPTLRLLWPDGVDSWRDTYRRHNHRLWDLYGRALITKEYLMRERFRATLLESGASEQEADSLWQHLDRRYLQLLGMKSRLVDGARELVEQLRSRGFRIGVLSNGFHEVQYNKLRSSGIDSLIDIVVLSDDIGINKPDRRLFDYALKQAGTTADRSILIGDNPETDIAGALAAGWHAIMLNRFGIPEEKIPAEAETVCSLRELM